MKGHSIRDGAAISYNEECRRFCGHCDRWVIPDTDTKGRESCPFCWNGFFKGSRYVEPGYVHDFYRILNRVLEESDKFLHPSAIYDRIMCCAPYNLGSAMGKPGLMGLFRWKLDEKLEEYVRSGKLSATPTGFPRAYILAEKEQGAFITCEAYVGLPSQSEAPAKVVTAPSDLGKGVRRKVMYLDDLDIDEVEIHMGKYVMTVRKEGKECQAETGRTD